LKGATDANEKHMASQQMIEQVVKPVQAVVAPLSELSGLLTHYQDVHSSLHDSLQELQYLLTKGRQIPGANRKQNNRYGSLADRVRTFRARHDDPKSVERGPDAKEKIRLLQHASSGTAVGSAKDNPQTNGDHSKSSCRGRQFFSLDWAGFYHEADLDANPDCMENGELGDGSESSSSSFDLDVCEEWAKRLQDVEVDLSHHEEDDSDPLINTPWLLRRLSSHMLEPIEEGSNEDDDSDHAQDAVEADRPSSAHSSDVERLWANVCEAGHGSKDAVVPTDVTQHAQVAKDGKSPHSSEIGKAMIDHELDDELDDW